MERDKERVGERHRGSHYMSEKMVHFFQGNEN